MDGVYVI